MVTTEGQDFHAPLGVPRDASLELIRHVYRQLARAYHCDANPGNPFGSEKLKQLTEARETLSDPALRGRYDLGLGPERDHATGDRREAGSRG